MNEILKKRIEKVPYKIDALGKMQPTEVWKEITKRARVRSSDEK